MEKSGGFYGVRAAPQARDLVAVEYSPVWPYHIPRGSMCMSCQHALRDCGNLDFPGMPVITKGIDWAVVRCTEFTKAAP